MSVAWVSRPGFGYLGGSFLRTSGLTDGYTLRGLFIKRALLVRAERVGVGFGRRFGYPGLETQATFGAGLRRLAPGPRFSGAD